MAGINPVSVNDARGTGPTASQQGLENLMGAFQKANAPAVLEQSEEKLAKLKQLLQQQSQSQSLQQIEKFMPRDKDGNPTLPNGAGISLNPEGASISKGYNPLQMMFEEARLKDAQSSKMSEEATRAQAHVDRQLKDGNTKMEAIKTTLSALDQGTEAGDTAAIFNEGQSIGGARGAVAFANRIDPSHTIPGLATKIANSINGQGTSELTPDIRNNMKELAFARGNELQKAYQQAKPGLSQQIMAGSQVTQRYGDVQNVVNSAFSPYEESFKDFNSRHTMYMQQKADAANQHQATANNQQAPYSKNQSVLSQIGSHVPGLSSLLGLGGSPSTPQQTAPQSQSPQDPGMARYQELLKKQQQGQ